MSKKASDLGRILWINDLQIQNQTKLHVAYNLSRSVSGFQNVC
jgi:hypothetical protein